MCNATVRSRETFESCNSRITCTWDGAIIASGYIRQRMILIASHQNGKSRVACREFPSRLLPREFTLEALPKLVDADWKCPLGVAVSENGDLFVSYTASLAQESLGCLDPKMEAAVLN